jgi:hypothetical protein
MNALTILGIIIFLSVIGFVFWLIWKKGNQNAINAREYNRRYILTDTLIDNFEVNKFNYDYILRLLEGLGQMKYKDKNRTIKLTNKFWAKFEPEASKIMNEHLNNK